MPESPLPIPNGWTLETDVVGGDGFRRVTYREDALHTTPGPVLTVRVADAATCRPLFALVDGSTVDMAGKGLIVDPVAGVWGVRFKWDGVDVNRIEHNPPWAFSGDTGTRLNPFNYAPGPHKLEVSGYATEADAQALRKPVCTRTISFVVAGPTPTPTPTPTPPPVVVTPGPTPTARQRLVAPATGPRPKFGRQLTKGGPTVVQDLHVSGFGTNLSYENAASLDVRNVVSADAYRDVPEWTFGGQGLYVDGVKGPVTIAGYAGIRNGWQPDKPATDRSMFRHALYANFLASPPAVTDYLAVGQPASGGLFRNGGSVDRFACLDCGIGMEGSQGVLTLTNGLIYGGGFYLVKDQHGWAWTGMIGVSSDAIVRLKSVWIVARPNQAAGDPFVQRHTQQTAARRYYGPALSANWKAADPGHPEWRPVPRDVEQIVCEDVHVVGWPGGQGNIFGGNGRQLRKGVTWHDTPVDYDYQPVVNAVLAGTVGIPEAVATLTRAIRSLVK